MSEPAVLELCKVSHAYDRVQAVVDADISVRAGEVVCLIGPSGCGKSTILRLAAGLETLQEGSIILRGRIVGDGLTHVPPEERHVGLVFQDFALFPHLTVAGNVAFGLGALEDIERARRVNETLRQVGLFNLSQSYPHSLSGGQQQRVALARALAPKPSLMLMDEPFSGLDARLREQVRDDTLRVLREHGTATLLVTHDPEEALFMADRLYLMRDGQIVQTGEPQDIYRRPVDLFAASFFSTVNTVACRVFDGRVRTALGDFNPPPGSDADAAIVAFRPESISIGDIDEARQGLRTTAVIDDLHFLGADWRVTLTARGPSGIDVRLIARGTGRSWQVGRSVAVFVPAEDMFLFGSNEQNSAASRR